MGKTGSTSKGEKTPGRNGPAARETGERARRVQARLREGPGSTGKKRVGGSWRECLANIPVFQQIAVLPSEVNTVYLLLFSFLTSQTACD